jgi:hypothetical protein
MSDKLISQLTAAANNLADADLAEGQKAGEVFSRKFTGLQMRGVEKGEREAQDNVIEASCGLQTDGSFVAPANSWFLRSADFTAGCTDRGGATGALTENLLNGLRLLDAKVNAMGSGNYVILQANVNADKTLTNIVPAGYMLTYVVFLEKAGTSPILDLGITPGGNEVFINQALVSSDLTTIVIQRVFSLSATTTLYLNDDDAGSNWNGSTVDAYFVMTPIIPGTAGGVVVMGTYDYDCNCAVPTNAIITACIGAASDYTNGSVFLIRDTDGGCNYIYFVESDGTNWYVNSAIFDLAV